MVLRPRNGISLCSGGGGLELGLQLAEPSFACRCFVEADAEAQSVLVGGMVPDELDRLHAKLAASGLPDSFSEVARDTPYPGRYARPFHEAALWPDVRTFVGDAWRGHIDLVSAGYPCQPFSAAGKRGGSDDPRHLWPDVGRIYWETCAEWGFFENVAGHLSLGLETVLRDLWDMGATPAVGLFSSGETDGSHERQRVFIVAHRPRADDEWRRRQSAGRKRPADCGRSLARANGQEQSTDRAESDAGPNGGNNLSRSGHADVADSERSAGHQRGASERGGSDRAQESRQAVSPSRPIPYLSPPGPGETAVWGHVLSLAPDLAPSLAFRDLVSRANDLAAMVAEGRVAEAQAQSDLRRMANAMAARPRLLRMHGNGVDPLVAGYAWRTLSAAHGLRPLDLATAHRTTGTHAGGACLMPCSPAHLTPTTAQE